jgi:hypothetical protein
LPESLRPALLAALSALYQNRGQSGPAGLSRRLVERALAASAGTGNPTVAALLERYAAEAAREEARDLAQAVVAEAEALELTTDDLVQEATPLAARDVEESIEIAAEDAEAGNTEAGHMQVPELGKAA